MTNTRRAADIKAMSDLESIIGRYHDRVVWPIMGSGIPDNVRDSMRNAYVQDIIMNPVALYQLAQEQLVHEAREPLAKHLYLKSAPQDWQGTWELGWDKKLDRVPFDEVYHDADKLLQVIDESRPLR